MLKRLNRGFQIGVLAILITLSVNSFAQTSQNRKTAAKSTHTFFDAQKAFNDYWKPYDVKGGYFINSDGNKQKAAGW